MKIKSVNFKQSLTRLSDEGPLNISSSYDTLRVKPSNWVPQTPTAVEKSFYKQVRSCHASTFNTLSVLDVLLYLQL